MAQIPDIIITLTKALVVGLLGIISFFIVDIHQMVKTDHDSMLTMKEASRDMQKDIVELKARDAEFKEQNDGFELLFRKILATLPNNDFDVSPKERQKVN